MKHEVIIPNVGESITEVFIGTWLKKTGDLVRKNEVLVDLETQKTSFELHAEVSGRIQVLHPEPETKVKPGDVIAIIDDAVSAEAETASAPAKAPADKSAGETAGKAAGMPAGASAKAGGEAILSPAARKHAAERGADVSALKGTGKAGRILKEDVLAFRAPEAAPPAGKSMESPAPPVFEYRVDTARGERAEPASRIRRTIAQNLVRAQHTAAILTTFNEADMSAVAAYRGKHKEEFKKRHGVSLGMVGFFAKAVVYAVRAFPLVNATFTGDSIIHRDFVDLSVAISTDAGLVVPVIRDVQDLPLSGFEKKLAELAEKAKGKKLGIQEMSGGSFTISNGGVFGSLLSTPILNMPQAAILGLHKIQDRPMAIEGKVVIRPMMYLALSYDHRLIDGREAVSFLVKVKEAIENLDLIVNEKDVS
jgi:2-oxoglutarate dehydrogenase E2 component (dihydrolipoamide succinyltransferase)